MHLTRPASTATRASPRTLASPTGWGTTGPDGNMVEPRAGRPSALPVSRTCPIVPTILLYCLVAGGMSRSVFPHIGSAGVLINVASGGALVTAGLGFSKEQTAPETPGHPRHLPSGPRLRPETSSHPGLVTSRLSEPPLGPESTLGDQATSARFIAMLQRTAGNRAVQSLFSRPEHRPSRGDAPSSAGAAETELTSLQRNCKSVSGTANLPHGKVLPAKFQTEKATKLTAPWDMLAEFKSDPPDPGVCGRCGEYRQYVTGKMERNGQAIAHPLADGNSLSPGQFHEDAGKYGSKVVKYGYHSMPFPQSTFEGPDQATGQKWTGWDMPGISGEAGDHLKLDLGFMGELVDTCHDEKKLTTPATWVVAGSGVVPKTE
jgi:hypothetical protein